MKTPFGTGRSRSNHSHGDRYFGDGARPNDVTGLRVGEAVKAYQRGRPTYPYDIIDRLLVDRPLTVIDRGAGIGKLTRSLVGRVPKVVAVEPDASRRAAQSAARPGTSVIAGTGEDIPLLDGFAEAVVVGQARHWMDRV